MLITLLLSWLVSFLACCSVLHLWFTTTLPVELVLLFRWIPAVRRRADVHQGEFQHMTRSEFDTWLVTLDVGGNLPRRLVHALICPGCLSVHAAAWSAASVMLCLLFLHQQPGWRECCVWWLACVVTTPWLCHRVMHGGRDGSSTVIPEEVEDILEAGESLPAPAAEVATADTPQSLKAPVTIASAGPEADQMRLTLRRDNGTAVQVCNLVVQRSTGLVLQEVCGEGGGNVVTATKDDVRRMRLFNPRAACWFAGCEELRRQYQQALDSLPADCPSCRKGELLREYLAKMASLGV